MKRSTESHIRGLFLGILLFQGVAVSSSDAFASEAIVIRTGLSRIDGNDLKRHLTTLASDSLEGREAGARGGKAAAAYLRSVLKTIRETSRSLPIETTQEFGRDYQNLLVFLPGSDETLKHEVVVVGAHYDHVGFGKASNSRGPIGHIHNGADDNASGKLLLLWKLHRLDPFFLRSGMPKKRGCLDQSIGWPIPRFRFRICALS